MKTQLVAVIDADGIIRVDHAAEVLSGIGLTVCDRVLNLCGHERGVAGHTVPGCGAQGGGGHQGRGGGGRRDRDGRQEQKK